MIMSILEVNNNKNNTSPIRCTRLSFMDAKIAKIGVTNDKISSRGGLPLILRYIERIGLYRLISCTITPLFSKNRKGLQLNQFLKQLFAFMIDGTNMSVSFFDSLKKELAYAALLEIKMEELASSHQIKRFFAKISDIGNNRYSSILNELFVWRLGISKPKIIILGIDTMVMDNDDAKKREGCEPTYKKKKGFQPLHIYWGPFLVDVLFRRGSAHSNHGSDYTDRIKAIVKLIRSRYSQKVPIILLADSGFADQKAYHCFEDELHIHYITTGKVYGEIKEYVQAIPLENFDKVQKDKVEWGFVEFANKLKSWTKFRRCIFTKQNCDKQGQYIINFSKPDNVIYTNIGTCPVADQMLKDAQGGGKYFEAVEIMKSSHGRGSDELINRSLKELATKEQLPFQSFGMNRSYYYILVITHFIFEAYKQDITSGVIPITVYPNTFRRNLIDLAVKITKRSRVITLNLTKAIYERFNFNELWARCQSPPEIQFH
jgi:hypothetical protein